MTSTHKTFTVLSIYALYMASLTGYVVHRTPAPQAASSHATIYAASINPSLYATGFCIDNGNQSGCASDSNDGFLCTCSGGGAHHGPLKTWSELWANRLGCGGGGLCPKWIQGNGLSNVLIKFLSSDTAEFIDFSIANENTSGIVIQGVLDGSKTIGTGTLSSFTAKPSDRKTGVTGSKSSGLYKAAISGITLAANELIFDSTHPAYFWPYYDITTAGGTPGVGDTWSFSQPLLGGPDIFQSQPTAEVSILSGDSVTVYAPPVILVNSALAKVYNAQAGNSVAPNVWFDQLILGNNTSNSMNANNGIGLEYVGLGANVQFVPGSNGITVLNGISAPNVAVDVSNSTGGFGGQQNLILGGFFGNPSNAAAQNTLTCNGCSIDGDTIFGQAPGIYSSSISSFGARFYVDGGVSMLVYPGGSLSFSGISGSPISPSGTQLWGPGGLEIFTGGSVIYPSGAGAAAATFTQVSTLTVFAGGISKPVCFVDSTQSTPSWACNVTPSAANLDSHLGTTIGCAFVPGGGTICN